MKHEDDKKAAKAAALKHIASMAHGDLIAKLKAKKAPPQDPLMDDSGAVESEPGEDEEKMKLLQMAGMHGKE